MLFFILIGTKISLILWFILGTGEYDDDEKMNAFLGIFVFIIFLAFVNLVVIGCSSTTPFKKLENSENLNLKEYDLVLKDGKYLIKFRSLLYYKIKRNGEILIESMTEKEFNESKIGETNSKQVYSPISGYKYPRYKGINWFSIYSKTNTLNYNKYIFKDDVEVLDVLNF